MTAVYVRGRRGRHGGCHFGISERQHEQTQLVAYLASILRATASPSTMSHLCPILKSRAAASYEETKKVAGKAHSAPSDPCIQPACHLFNQYVGDDNSFHLKLKSWR
jgi:hypothetical protein